MYAVQIVKQEEISCKKLTKLSKIVSISVSFPIDVIKEIQMEK